MMKVIECMMHKRRIYSSPLMQQSAVMPKVLRYPLHLYGYVRYGRYH